MKRYPPARSCGHKSRVAQEDPPYWTLISVLFSSFPLSETVATTLHQAAYELYTSERSVTRVDGDLLSGEVRSLGTDALVGSIGGPMFEASVETERGAGTVRFFLTRSGLELMHAHNAVHTTNPGKREYLH